MKLVLSKDKYMKSVIIMALFFFSKGAMVFKLHSYFFSTSLENEDLAIINFQYIFR